jgi:hypothetical protein
VDIAVVIVADTDILIVADIAVETVAIATEEEIPMMVMTVAEIAAVTADIN